MTIFLEDDCQDEISKDSCLIIKESGSCNLDLAKTHCKKTCEKCEDDEGITAIPSNKNIILRFSLEYYHDNIFLFIFVSLIFL